MHGVRIESAGRVSVQYQLAEYQIYLHCGRPEALGFVFHSNNSQRSKSHLTQFCG